MSDADEGNSLEEFKLTFDKFLVTKSIRKLLRLSEIKLSPLRN